MNIDKATKVSFSLLLLPVLFFLAIVFLSFKQDEPLSIPGHDILRYWKSAFTKSLNQTHVFIPANHPNLHVGLLVYQCDGLCTKISTVCRTMDPFCESPQTGCSLSRSVQVFTCATRTC